MRSTLLFTIIFLFSCPVFAQVNLSGLITEDQNKPVPFDSVYIKNTTKGTSANSEGEYILQLKPGVYEVLYKAVGYKQESRKIDLSSNQVLNVVLPTET